jgi:hypothetical protein
VTALFQLLHDRATSSSGRSEDQDFHGRSFASAGVILCAIVAILASILRDKAKLLFQGLRGKEPEPLQCVSLLRRPASEVVEVPCRRICNNDTRA